MKQILWIWCMLLLAAPVEAATRCNVLSNDSGLSNSSVTCIYQDSLGVLWFGTWDGLNRYDGSGFRVYKFEPDNPNTISNNVIRRIVEESSGVLWVATDYGINRIDVNRNRVERFYPGYETSSPVEERSFSVAASPDGEVFCSALGWGVARYDPRRGQLAPLNIPHVNTSEIRALCAPAPGRLLLLTTSGDLYRVYCTTSADSEYPEATGTVHLLPDRRIMALFDASKTIYIATEESTILAYDRITEGFSREMILPLASKERLSAVAEYPMGRLACAFEDSDARVYNPDTGTFSPLEGLGGIPILSLWYGSQDILWAGSDGRGILSLCEDDLGFNRTDNRQMSGEKSAPVRAFFEDPHGNLYIATKGNGIRVLHADGSFGGAYDRSNGLSSASVYALACGWNDDLFIGHDGEGLDVLSLVTGRISTLVPLPGTHFGSIYAILRDSVNGCLWLGTNGCGLVGLSLERLRSGRYAIQEQRIYMNDKNDSKSLSNNSVFAIASAGGGRLWLGTRGGGLNLFDPFTGHFSSHTTTSDVRPISSNDILSLYVGRDSTLWIGTGYGLNRLVRESDGTIGFQWYTEKEGLPNNTVHGILEDDTGKLWLSTNKGLATLDPATEQIVSYYKFKALQSNEFSDGAYYRSSSGEMFFGGVDGFNRFNPDDIHMRDYAPPVLLQSFFVRQKPMANFPPSEEIVLSHDENFFSIQFSALEYIRNECCEYSYILRGFNDDWVYTGTVNTAVFTNVPPGSYEFAVRATNGDKVWGDREATLRIRVRPPWWNTPLAYIVYLMLAGGLVYAAYFITNERIEQRRSLLVESMTRTRQRESYEAKLRFFTSIAHEFCTPLTMIYASGEQMLGSYSLAPDVARHVRIIRNNAARMQRLIGELMDFRRADTGHYEPRYEEIDVVELVSSIVDNFNEVNEQRRIDLRLTLPEDDVTIVSDRDALDKIFHNLISNAYKYTPRGGWISIELMIGTYGTHFRISNSGQGIQPEDLAHVFDRFEILDNFERSANEGRILRNGIGLALSQSLATVLSGSISVESVPGASTTFTLMLPVVPRERVAVQEPLQPRVATSPEALANFDLPESSTSSNGSGAVILVVDDEPQIRTLVSEILGASYTVLQASDGKAAIELLKRRRPDLILSDIVMPNIDGVELLRYLKQNEITRYIPFVFLTFKSEVEHEIRGYELGGDGYIAKPFHPKHLLAVVRQILTNRETLRSYYNSAISRVDLYEGDLIDADAKKFIVQLTRIIEENLTDENLSLNYLCDRMCVSRMGLYRKIKEIARMTPSEYIRSVKLRHATHLLRTTNMTIQEVMFCSGFNNKSYFYREFAREYHMSPKEMRSVANDATNAVFSIDHTDRKQ